MSLPERCGQPRHAFGLGEALQVATDIDEDAGEFWSDGGDRPVDPLAGGNDVVAHVGR